MTEISRFDDIIDSRDVIARIEEIKAEDKTPETAEELKALEELAKQGEDYCSDWKYGETLIHEDYFEDYARELAEDIGAIDKDAKWPLQYIDWEEAAEALRMDYTELDFDGQVYYAR